MPGHPAGQINQSLSGTNARERPVCSYGNGGPLIIEEYSRHDCGHEGNDLGRAEIVRRETMRAVADGESI